MSEWIADGTHRTSFSEGAALIWSDNALTDALTDALFGALAAAFKPPLETCVTLLRANLYP